MLPAAFERMPTMPAASEGYPGDLEALAEDLVARGTRETQHLTQIHPITWIPFIEYLGALILAGIFGVGLWAAGWVRSKRLSGSRAAGV
jgi:hypothetical protein